MLMLRRFCCRELLRHLPVERFEGVGELSEIRPQYGLFPQLELFGQSRVPSDLKFSLAGEAFNRAGVAPRRLFVIAASVERALQLGRSGSRSVDRIAAPRGLGHTRIERILGAQRVCGGFRGIELQEQVSRLDGLALLDVDRGNLAGIERLNHLGVAGRFDLAWRRRMDVQPAEIRPHQRRKREGGNRRHQRDRQRRGRGFEDFERGRQEFAIAPRDHDRRRPRRPGLRRRSYRRRSAFVHAGVLT